jgi:hypothetical protein
MAALALAVAACTHPSSEAQPSKMAEGGTGKVSNAADPSLIHRYSFTSDAKDWAGKVDGVLKNGAKITDGKVVLANSGKASDAADLGYVDFPSSILPKTGSASIVLWYTGTSAENFARLLDIGDREGAEGRAFIYLTPRTSGGNSRVRISAVDTRSSQVMVEGPAIDDGKPHCIAIVFDTPANHMHLFVDGKEAAAAADLGANNLATVKPVHTWIGRSGYDQDPGLSGSIDELRVYDKALNAQEVLSLANLGPDKLPAK